MTPRERVLAPNGHTEQNRVPAGIVYVYAASNDSIVALDSSPGRGTIPLLHCCGQIWDILDDFVAAGYNGYQSIQESAGMRTSDVARAYSNELTLWTGVRCETFVEGSGEDVEREVRHSLAVFMPGGGCTGVQKREGEHAPVTGAR